MGHVIILHTTVVHDLGLLRRGRDGLARLVVNPFSVPVCASVVDEEPASGGGDVVGVGVVDFDVVDGLDGAGRLDGVEVDGLSGVVAEGVFCGELAGGGEASLPST